MKCDHARTWHKVRVQDQGQWSMSGSYHCSQPPFLSPAQYLSHITTVSRGMSTTMVKIRNQNRVELPYKKRRFLHPSSTNTSKFKDGACKIQSVYSPLPWVSLPWWLSSEDGSCCVGRSVGWEPLFEPQSHSGCCVLPLFLIHCWASSALPQCVSEIMAFERSSVIWTQPTTPLAKSGPTSILDWEIQFSRSHKW